MKKRITSVFILFTVFASYFIMSCRHDSPIPASTYMCDMHLSASVTNVNSSQRGMIVVHAHNGSGFTYQLNDGAAQQDSSFSNLDPASYMVYVTNSAGCRDSIHVVVDSTSSSGGTGGGGTGGGGGGTTCPTINVMAMPTNPTSGSNGSISASATGGVAPYSYSINGGAFSSNSNFTGLAAGNYTIAVKDANNCPGTSSQVTLSGGGGTCPTIVVTGTPTRTSTICATDATFAASASGGVAPYTYSKDGTTFQTSATISTLAVGSYTITAKDANGCTGNMQVTVSGPTTVSFATSIQPIVASYCGSAQISCHNHNNNWTTYSDIVGSSMGATWSGNLSTFLKRLRGTSGSANSACPLTTSSGSHNMPPSNSTAWTNFVKGPLTNWIDQGYPNN